MQPGMNAQRRLAYPEVKHPTASGIRIGAGPGSEHMEKKKKESVLLAAAAAAAAPTLPAGAKRAECSRRLHRLTQIGRLADRKKGSTLIGWQGI